MVCQGPARGFTSCRTVYLIPVQFTDSFTVGSNRSHSITNSHAELFTVGAPSYNTDLHSLSHDLQLKIQIQYTQETVHPKKLKLHHHLLILHLFQACVSLFLLLNAKEDILKNVGNQTVDGSHWLTPHSIFFHTLEVNGYRQLGLIDYDKNQNHDYFGNYYNHDYLKRLLVGHITKKNTKCNARLKYSVNTLL